MNIIFTSPTPDLEESLTFYRSLGFTLIEAENRFFIVSRQLVMEIDPKRTARAGVKVYGANIQQLRSQLDPLAVIHEYDSGFLLSDPSNVWIYIEDKAYPSLNTEDGNSVLLGAFAGMSLETTDIQKSVAIWSCFGLEKSMGDITKGWVSYTNNRGFDLSFMAPNTCPHLFFNPSLTYFNSGKNPEIIRNIRDAGIPIKEEIRLFNPNNEVDNVILQDPGGFGFFVFND